jgi:hypothetical protein
MVRTDRTISCDDTAVRALFPLAALLLAGCREKPRATPEPEPPRVVEDAATDTLAAAVDELFDGSIDAPPLKGEVTIAKVEVKPKDAFPGLDLSTQRWRFLRCYEAPGEVTVSVRVGEGGEPIAATGAACLATAAKHLTFPEPVGGIATVDLTLHFSAR